MLENVTSDLRRIHWYFVCESSDTINQPMKEKLDIALKKMQEKYPGNYKIQEFFDFSWFAYSFRLVFESPEDESMFILRYSEQ